MVKPVSGISSSRGKRYIIVLIRGGGFRGKQIKNFESLSSVHTSELVINGPLDIAYQEGFSDG